VIADLQQRYKQQLARYLIVAGYPTPNGPLHLGHIGGPFLRGDVLRRYLVSRGHIARAVGTSDSWESNILFTAAKEQRPPMTVARDYHQRIMAALGDFDIGHDAYLDIHAAPYAAEHRRYSDALVNALYGEGRLTLHREVLLYDQVARRPVVGCWLTGRCPNCGTGAAGNSCESCGLWFGPTDMLDAGPRLGSDAAANGDRYSNVTVTTAFASPADLMRAERCAGRIGHSGAYLPILEDYWRWNEKGIRLSYPIEWGLPWPLPGPDHGSVHYSYGTGLVAASRVIGDFIAQRYGGASPMSEESDTITVAIGGVDAVMPWLVLLGLISPKFDFKPYDYFLFNRFLNLHGEKFSTSRRHTIWVGDYVAAGLDVDCARLYLASISPATETRDFRCDTFAGFAAAWAERLDRTVQARAATLANAGPRNTDGVPAAAVSAMADAFEAQDRCLGLPDTDINAAVSVLRDWVERGATGSGNVPDWWYLWALAILAAPLVPRWASRLWAALGLAGEPVITAAAADTTVWSAGRYASLQAPAEAVLRFLMENPSQGGYPDDTRVKERTWL
jgi:methionyl-tRNA synthetase